MQIAHTSNSSSKLSSWTGVRKMETCAGSTLRRMRISRWSTKRRETRPSSPTVSTAFRVRTTSSLVAVDAYSLSINTSTMPVSSPPQTPHCRSSGGARSACGSCRSWMAPAATRKSSSPWEALGRYALLRLASGVSLASTSLSTRFCTSSLSSASDELFFRATERGDGGGDDALRIFNRSSCRRSSQVRTQRQVGSESGNYYRNVNWLLLTRLAMLVVTREELSIEMAAQHWRQWLETGAVVELAHAGSTFRFRTLVERKGDGDTGGKGASAASPVVSLCSLDHPYEKLRVALNAAVGWSIAAAKFAALQIEEASDEELPAMLTAPKEAVVYVHFRLVAHQKKPNRAGGVGWYLGLASANESSTGPELVGDASRGAETVFAMSLVSTRGAFALDNERTVLHGSFRREPSRMLTDSQRHAFMLDGYLQIRDVVPMKLINAVLRRINHELGIPGRMVDGGVEGTGKLAGNVSNSQDLLNLFFQSEAGAYAEALVGEGKIVPPRGGQIALRFPELGDPRDPHGTEWHTDGMRQGRRHPFSLLLGVTLSEAREPLAGNFTVFPGSHRSLHKLLRDDGKLDGYDDECYRADSVWGDGTLPNLGTPVQLLAGRGDIVLAHPNLAHRGGLNFSPDIRYQVYFRLKHVDHGALQARARESLWIDLEGLHHLEETERTDE